MSLDFEGKVAIVTGSGGGTGKGTGDDVENLGAEEGEGVPALVQPQQEPVFAPAPLLPFPVEP